MQPGKHQYISFNCKQVTLSSCVNRFFAASTAFIIAFKASEASISLLQSRALSHSTGGTRQVHGHLVAASCPAHNLLNRSRRALMVVDAYQHEWATGAPGTVGTWSTPNTTNWTDFFLIPLCSAVDTMLWKSFVPINLVIICIRFMNGIIEPTDWSATDK